MTDTRSKNWKQKKIGTHICVFGTATLNFLSSEVYRCVRVYEAIFFQITQMLWSKDDHSSHTFKEEALLKIIFVYAFRKNNIWHKVLRTILLHMSFAFSWSGPDCRPYFCGKAVKGQEEGATLIVGQRLNILAICDISTPLICSNIYTNRFFYLSILKNLDHCDHP